MAKRTVKAFDEMCLTPADDMPPGKIRALRLRENASQAVFARRQLRTRKEGEDSDYIVLPRNFSLLRQDPFP